MYFKYLDLYKDEELIPFHTRETELDDIAEAAAKEIWDHHVDPTAFEDGEIFTITLFDDDKEFLAVAEIRVEIPDPEFVASILEKKT